MVASGDGVNEAGTNPGFVGINVAVTKPGWEVTCEPESTEIEMQEVRMIVQRKSGIIFFIIGN
jgi:hypothetical protein